MALTVTPGGATDDSFVTVARASSLLAEEYDTADWDKAATPVKERLLRLATRQLTQLVAWHGTKTNASPTVQRLPWPRMGLYYADTDGGDDLWYGAGTGIAIPSTIIPEWLERATAVTAFRLFIVNAQLSGSGQSQDIKRLRVDQGELDIEWRENAGTGGSPEAVSSLPEEVIRLIESYGHVAGWHAPRVLRR